MKSRLPIFAGLTLAAVLAGAAAAHRRQQGAGGAAAVSPRATAVFRPRPMPDAASTPRGAPRRGMQQAASRTAAELMVEACERLQRHPAVSAKIRHRVDQFGHVMAGSGAYSQGPWNERRWRMELRIQAGGDLTTWQQVSDGRYVWTYQQLIGNPKLSRVDLDEVQYALAAAAADAAQPGSFDALTLGGLPHMLGGLRDSFEFISVQPARLANLPVWVLRGAWTREMLGTLLPRQQDRLESGAAFDQRELAEHVPDLVVVTLGQDDLFPYRIEYVRTAATLSDDEREAGAPARTLVSLELFEVRLGGAVDPVQFTYNPGSQPVADGTAEFLRKLGVEP